MPDKSLVERLRGKAELIEIGGDPMQNKTIALMREAALEIERLQGGWKRIENIETFKRDTWRQCLTKDVNGDWWCFELPERPFRVWKTQPPESP